MKRYRHCVSGCFAQDMRLPPIFLNQDLASTDRNHP
jgi:hypothetical protein